MRKKDIISTTKLAEILGISRIAIFKKIKKGELKAFKLGRNYVIPIKSLSIALGKKITENQKRTIEEAVRKTVSEYGDVLKRLGME